MNLKLNYLEPIWFYDEKKNKYFIEYEIMFEIIDRTVSTNYHLILHRYERQKRLNIKLLDIVLDSEYKQYESYNSEEINQDATLKSIVRNVYSISKNKLLNMDLPKKPK